LCIKVFIAGGKIISRTTNYDDKLREKYASDKTFWLNKNLKVKVVMY